MRLIRIEATSSRAAIGRQIERKLAGVRADVEALRARSRSLRKIARLAPPHSKEPLIALAAALEASALVLSDARLATYRGEQPQIERPQLSLVAAETASRSRFLVTRDMPELALRAGDTISYDPTYEEDPLVALRALPMSSAIDAAKRGALQVTDGEMPPELARAIAKRRLQLVH